MEQHESSTAVVEPTKNKAGRKSGGLAPKGTRNAVARTDARATFAPLKGAAAVRGVPYWIARRAASDGEFEIAKFGRVIHVRWQDFDAWIARQMERRNGGV